MIEVKNVSKTFYPGTRKEQKVLENASLELPDKGLVCLVGPSGSGKSTILNAIGGLISYDGKILYDGNEEKIEDYRRNHIGYIFQDFLLFENLSIRDNIKIGLHLASVYDEKEVSRRTEILLNAVSLNVNSSRLVKALSLGQKQRVGIARALANSPKILLADEPTGNLDSKNSLRIMDILKELSKDRLVLIVTHNMSLVNLYADEAYRLENRGFARINPKGEEVSQVYEEETQNVRYQKEETKIGSLTVSFYSQSEKGERRITIVERNGKLLISGENIALVSKEDIQPIVDKVAEASSNPQQEKEDVSEATASEENQAEKKPEPSLSFESRKDRKPLREHSFFLSLFHHNPLSQTKYKGKTSFRVIEIILPLVAFFFFNLYYAGLNTYSDLYPSYVLSDHLVSAHYTEEKAKEIHKDFSAMVSVSVDDYLSWPEEDSAIISAPFDTPMGTDGGLFSGGFSKRGYYMGIPDFYLSFPNGDFYSYTVDSSSTTKGIFPIEEYSSLFPEELGKYDLAEDEVLLDTSLIGNKVSSLYRNLGEATITLFDNVLENPGVYGSSSRLDLSTYKTMSQYKVKGIVDTGFQAIYARKDVCDKAKMISFASSSNGFYHSSTSQYLFAPGIARFPSLKDMKFYRYEEHSSDSDLTYQDLSTLSENNQSSYLSSLSGCLYADGLPYAVLSDSAKSIWSIYQSNDGVIYSPAFIIDSGTVSSIGNPGQKMMVFRKTKYNGEELDSFAEFYRYLVVEKLLNNFQIDDSYDEEEKNADHVILHLPQGLAESFPGVSFNPQEDEYSSVLATEGLSSSKANYGFYMRDVEFGSPVASSSIDDPIVLSRYSYYRFLCSLKGVYSVISPSLSGSNGKDDVLGSAYRDGQFFLSKDPGKTIAYLNGKYQNQGLVFDTVKNIQNDIASQQMNSQARMYLIVLLVLFLLFILFTILNYVGKINSLRYNIGVERCLGAKKWEVIRDCLGDTAAGFLTDALIPTLLLSVLLLLVGLYYCGWKILLFFLFYLVIELLAVLIPLLILLAKKPADILRSLN